MRVKKTFRLSEKTVKKIEFQKAFQFGVHQFFKYLNAKKGESYE